MDEALSVGDRCPDALLVGVDGPVRFAELWTAAPLILVFLRHFG
jgi:hypothetical protein